MNTVLRIIISSLLIFPAGATAATAVVEVDTGKERINALEGTFILPEEMAIPDVQTGNSAILMWVIPPTSKDHAITFSGITPGGFSGSQPIFTVKGTFTARDLEQTKFVSVAALRDDGLGTRVPVKLTLAMVEAGESEDDSVPPESFSPLVSHSPNLFDGKYFLVFATQDKGSGVSHYEVCEGLFGSCVAAESPHLLHDQSRRSLVVIRAYDRAGNVTKTTLWPEFWLTFPHLLGWLVLIVLVLFLSWLRLGRRSN